MQQHHRFLARLLTALCAALVAASLSSAADHDGPVEVKAVALFTNQAVLEINGKRRILKSGAQSPEGVLLIRASSDAAVVKIDDKELTVRLDGRIIGKYPKSREARTVRLFPNAGGHYFVDGLIEGSGVNFLIDTGATSVVINKDDAKRIGLLYRVDGRRTMVETASGLVPAYNVKFDEVKIRSLALKRVDGIVIEGAYPRKALLGQSFLNRINMHREGDMLELTER